VNPIHQFPSEEAGGSTVWLVAYSPLGCPDSTYRVITINEELIFYIPNTVTPDNDDYNQNWHVVFSSGYDPFDFNLYVYNRWGELIWESHDASVGWDATYGLDGREVQDGTYTWKIDFKTTVNDERIQVVGHVNVLR
jgi:gliding motility-associated-like protein